MDGVSAASYIYGPSRVLPSNPVTLRVLDPAQSNSACDVFPDVATGNINDNSVVNNLTGPATGATLGAWRAGAADLYVEWIFNHLFPGSGVNGALQQVGGARGRIRSGGAYVVGATGRSQILNLTSGSGPSDYSSTGGVADTFLSTDRQQCTSLLIMENSSGHAAFTTRWNTLNTVGWYDTFTDNSWYFDCPMTSARLNAAQASPTTTRRVMLAQRGAGGNANVFVRRNGVQIASRADATGSIDAGSAQMKMFEGSGTTAARFEQLIGWTTAIADYAVPEGRLL
jgi:hypothetical protein